MLVMVIITNLHLLMKLCYYNMENWSVISKLLQNIVKCKFLFPRLVCCIYHLVFSISSFTNLEFFCCCSDLCNTGMPPAILFVTSCPNLSNGQNDLNCLPSITEHVTIVLLKLIKNKWVFKIEKTSSIP